MHGVLSNLTAALLALHTVLGCCWHHAHSDDAQTGAVIASDACHDGHASPSGGAADACGQGHHGSHDCHESKCSFVSTSSPDGNSFAQPFQASVTRLLDDQHPLVGASFEQRLFATGWLLSPVRLHLANQIMLI
jgi:hypothetical protein